MSGDLDGKRILVTGATSGIGKEAARALAGRGATLIVSGRDAARTETARAEVAAVATGPAPEVVLMDLASQASIRAGAAELLARGQPLHVLINNAGLLATRRQVSADGLELTFAVNTLAPLLLTQLLLPALRRGAPARVVMVSSTLHHRGKLDLDDLQLDKTFGVTRAYANSKLALNVLTRELARRHAGQGITFNSLHPGSISTDITRQMPWILRKLAPLVTRSAAVGARPLVLLAAAPELAATTGHYFDKLKDSRDSAAGVEAATAARLWDLSEALLARSA